jgi:hypothetical protein
MGLRGGEGRRRTATLGFELVLYCVNAIRAIELEMAVTNCWAIWAETLLHKPNLLHVFLFLFYFITPL